MKRLTLDIIMAAGLALSLVLRSFSGFAQECEGVQESVLRLHIPANSDSENDQSVKLQLRDYILAEYGAQLSEEQDLAAAERRIVQLLPELERDCNEFLSRQGVDYGAKAELTEMYFTTRTYEEVTLPAGTYTALRVTLGSGEGHNWWCVMFPPLCIPVAAERNESCAMLPDALVYGDDGSVEVKFALYEFLKKLLG
ncbi:MAG: stage II sporulation protein R [Ruminococcaceae bacterium]|nr:stage II sporulation protein R [Oscillospiraceae bacterium]